MQGGLLLRLVWLGWGWCRAGLDLVWVGFGGFRVSLGFKVGLGLVWFRMGLPRV